jgi:hypothetical protein
VTSLAASRPLYGLVSVAHYSGVFLSVGSIVLLDLRILGFAASRQALAALGEQLRPWTWIGLGTVVVSGFVLFAVDAGDFAAAALFRLKILVTLVAVLSALAVEWNLEKWDRAPATPLTARLVALASIVLWLGAILLSVEIPAITGLG